MDYADSLLCPQRGEVVPMPYGKSHLITESLLGRGVKGSSLTEVHHSQFQHQFQALECFYGGLLCLCRKCWCPVK